MTDKPKEFFIEIGGKQVPVNKVNKPHYLLFGGPDKPIPNVPPKPLAAEKESEPKNESKALSC